MQFERELIIVNDIPVTMLTAGKGDPLVFWHGAGTWHGFDFALPWTANFKVIIPFHPGFGESGEAPHLSTVDDYMLHYLDLFDALGLDKIYLAGISMGGRFAATFAVEHRERVRKLVLIAPAGLDVPEHPMPDFSKVPPEEMPRYLVHDFSVLEKHLPKSPDPEFAAAREREGGNFGKLMQNGLFGPWLPRWLHRVNMPTLLIWGEQDRILPFGQAAAWKRLIPHARLLRVPDAGHLPIDEKPALAQTVANFLVG